MLITYSKHFIAPLSLKHKVHTSRHILYRSHLPLRNRGKRQMCVYTAAGENNKARHANWADGIFLLCACIKLALA